MTRLQTLAAPGLRAVRHNAKAILIIQALAVAAVTAYYTSPEFAQLFGRLGKINADAGWTGVAVSTVFACYVIPETARRALLKERTGLVHSLFQIVFFAIIGMVVNLFYILVGGWIGTEATPAVVLKKVLVDQLIFSPVVTMPYSGLMFLWADHQFHFGETLKAIREGEWSRRHFPLQISCWAYWIPILFAVFAMPSDLQFVLFLFAMAAWSLLLVTMNRIKQPVDGSCPPAPREHREHDRSQPPPTSGYRQPK